MKRKVIIGLGVVVAGFVTYEFLVKAPPDDVELSMAVAENDVLKVRNLLIRGANASSALNHAIDLENVEMVRLLLSKGANARGVPSTASPSSSDRTPLEAAIYPNRSHPATDSLVLTEEQKQQIHARSMNTGNVEIIEMLLARDVDVNKNSPTGRTPLGYAARHGHADVIRTLLKAGADVNAKDERHGMPALAYATRPEVVHLLLDEGADVNARDKEGRTALEWARITERLSDRERGNVVDMLKSAGAEEN